MELDPTVLVNAGGLALFAILVLIEIRKIGPAIIKIGEILARMEERNRAIDDRLGVLESRLENFDRRRLVTPHGGIAPRRPPPEDSDR